MTIPLFSCSPNLALLELEPMLIPVSDTLIQPLRRCDVFAHLFNSRAENRRFLDANVL